MDGTVVRARDVRMRYGGAEVLRGVDLDVRAGEVVALLGPNGAGKGGDTWRARLGVVLQNWQDHPRWGVRQLLAHITAFHDRPRDPDELLAVMGLTGQAGQRVGRAVAVLSQLATYVVLMLVTGMTVFLPDSMLAAEIAGSRRPLETAGVLGAWAAAGLLIAPWLLLRATRRESGARPAARRRRRAAQGAL